MNKSMALIAAALAGNTPQFGTSARGIRVFKKACAECGTMHTHNNRWCSAECCESYRNKQGDTIGTSKVRTMHKLNVARGLIK